jgi:hypothetical protein
MTGCRGLSPCGADLRPLVSCLNVFRIRHVGVVIGGVIAGLAAGSQAMCATASTTAMELSLHGRLHYGSAGRFLAET